MNKKVLLVIGGAIAAFYFLGKKKIASDQLVWRFTGFDFKRIAIQIELINPTNTSLNFSAFVAEVLVNDNQVGILDYRQQTKLSGNSNKVISIPIKINPMAAITFIPFLLNRSAIKNAKIVLKGTINAENISIPFSTPINIA